MSRRREGAGGKGGRAPHVAQQRLLDGIVELVTADGGVLAHAWRAIAAHIGRDHGAAPMLFEGAAPPSSRAAARR